MMGELIATRLRETQSIPPRFSRRLHDRQDRHLELTRNSSRVVVPRHTHDGAGAVTHQDIIRDPNWTSLVTD